MGNGVSCFYPEGRELLRVAEQGDVNEVKGVLSSDIALTRYRTLTMGNTAWHKAAKAGRLEVLMEMVTLLEAALQAHHKSLESKDPARVLWRLGSSSRQVIAKLLNQRNHRGQTPLMVACAEGHDGCAKYLAESGADPFLQDKQRGQTCLHYAALYGHAAVVRELLKAVEDPRQPGAAARLLAQGNMAGLTPLHYACYAERVEAVRVLLAFRPNLVQAALYGDVDWISVDAGATPLHVAALKGNVEVVRALLKAFVEVAGDLMPGTAGSTSASPTRRRDPRAFRNDYGKLPYHLAVRRGHFHLTDWLDPSVPLRWLLTGEELGGGSEIGPPRLAVIAASVLHLKLMQQLDTIEALGLIRQSEAAGAAAPAGPPADAEPCSSGMAGGPAEAMSRRSSRKALSRSASKVLADQLLRGMHLHLHRRTSSSGRGLNPLLDEALMEQAAELCKMAGGSAAADGAAVDFSACMPLPGAMHRRSNSSRRASRDPSLSGSPELPGMSLGAAGAAAAMHEPGGSSGGGYILQQQAQAQQPEGGGLSGGNRRASRDGAPLGLGLLPGAERLDTVEEGTSRASSIAQIPQHRGMLESPFAQLSTSPHLSEQDDEGGCAPVSGSSSSSMVRARSAPQALSGSASSGSVPVAAVTVRAGGSLKALLGGGGGGAGVLKACDSDAQSKLDMLARIRLDIASEPFSDGAASCSTSSPPQLPPAASLLSSTPSALLDAVLKPFRRSSHRIQPSDLPGDQRHAAATASAAAAAFAGGEDEDEEEDMCGVCLDVDVNAMMQPCGHRICVTCAKDMCRRYTVATALCPYCRAIISDFEYARALC